MSKLTIDFETMRECCIQIHQETFELFKVANHIGEDIDLCVESADELRTHEETKTWDGMGRYAKELYDNEELWSRMPEEMAVRLDVAFQGQKKVWNKEEARKELIRCYYELGGKNLYNAQD